MKKLFPLLLAYVFLTVEGWALSGGPVFSSGNTSDTLGTFAGVLTTNGGDSSTDVSTGSTTTTSTGTGASGEDNSLGVFAIGVPSSGVASGGFVYFTQGRTYSGAILGLADPDTLQFRGLVKAQFNIDVNFGSTTDPIFGTTTNGTASFPAGYASGSIDCQIFPSALGSGFGGGTLATRLTGTASLSVQGADTTTGLPSGPITTLDLSVDGFKQSSTADISADLTTFGITQTGLTGSSSN